ncbi:MAG: SIS domain-containing protein [Acidobacteria bacterium]|nr:SIS domain-containing protein [Acidobacteriota bacterium]MCW5969542.1 SIS domain-containing protein [Blastocatellales bacterium]
MSLMLTEIAEQPRALERTIRREGRRIAQFAEKIRQQRLRLIVLVARGSSDNAAMFGRYLLEVETGIPVSLAAPSVHTLYRARLDLRDALVIGISQSGEGADINLVLENAKKCGALTLGITNEAGSAMTRIADETFLLHAGRERSVAATKTYTGQLMILHLLARALGRRRAVAAIERIPELAAASLTLRPQIEEMVERYAYVDHCVVVGRGLNYANAYEFAIKLMETCYVVAERFSSADFLHGPIAMVERGFPAFLFAPPGPSLTGMKELLAKLNALGAETVVISSEAAALRSAHRAIRIPVRMPEVLTPIPYIIPAQMFAALLAEARGLSPDRPRSLQKVTHTV